MWPKKQLQILIVKPNLDLISIQHLPAGPAQLCVGSVPVY